MSKVEYKAGDRVVLTRDHVYSDVDDNDPRDVVYTKGTYAVTERDYEGDMFLIQLRYPDGFLGFVLGSGIAPAEDTTPSRDLLPHQLWALTDISNIIHQSMKDLGWWDEAGNPLIISNKIALAHSELSEALEGARKDLQDDHLPQYAMLHVELADALYRILDLCGFLGIDIGEILSKKHAYNMKRADHKRENRKVEGGKKF